MATDLAVIEAALEAATPGPWRHAEDGDGFTFIDRGPGILDYVLSVTPSNRNRWADADLIVLLRNTAAELVERVKAAEAEVEQMRSGSRCPQCSATEWGESGRQRGRAETAEATIARVRKVTDELLQPSYLFPEGQRGVVHKILEALEGGSNKRG